jgi:hypothetical protein
MATDTHPSSKWLEDPTNSPYIGQVFRDKRTREQAQREAERLADALDAAQEAGADAVTQVIDLLEQRESQ